MDEIVRVFLSWQFLLVGIVVYFVFGLFNGFLGPKLWKIRNMKWRSIMKFLEGIKMVWPPLIGFGLGWIPGMPRPDALAESSTLTVALLYIVAGLGCQWIVKGIKKALEARGIDVELDMTPQDQKKAKCK
jgi:hypothetical protein